jgi:D-sedoheptulose 7-phosphate isomerase
MATQLSDVIRNEFNDALASFQAMAADAAIEATMLEALALCEQALRNGGKILFAGNGGSAADAQHWAGELVSRFYYDRPGLPAIALTTDTSILTAIGNDYGYEHTFARQVQALGRAGDVLVALSTSGNSPNILRAVEAARAAGVKVVGFTGRKGGALASACDACFRVPADLTPRIQEGHEFLGHLLCSLIEARMSRDERERGHHPGRWPRNAPARSRARPAQAARARRGPPFLAHLLDRFARAGLRRAILASGYRAEMIEDAIGMEWQGMQIVHSLEIERLGTGGALRHAARLLTGHGAHVVNGDTWLAYDPIALERTRTNATPRSAWRSRTWTTLRVTARWWWTRAACSASPRRRHGRGWINAARTSSPPRRWQRCRTARPSRSRRTCSCDGCRRPRRRVPDTARSWTSASRRITGARRGCSRPHDDASVAKPSSTSAPPRSWRARRRRAAPCSWIATG